MIFAELLNDLHTRFARAGIESADFEAELLIAESGRFRRTEFFLHKNEPVPENLREKILSLAARRAAHEPLQYLLGTAPFRELELKVTPSVLIPRPETELLVDFVLEKLPEHGKMLDVGCGSGAIALSVAYERPDCGVMAVDCSRAALEIAMENRAKYHLEHVTMQISDLFSSIPAGERFDVIAANLPYVSEEEYADLSPEVRDHEPKLALTAPDAGYALIDRCAAACGGFLRCGGYVIFELAPAQTGRLRGQLLESDFEDVMVHRDYPGRERFVSGRKKSTSGS